jgi:hypothetical protein
MGRFTRFKWLVPHAVYLLVAFGSYETGLMQHSSLFSSPFKKNGVAMQPIQPENVVDRTTVVIRCVDARYSRGSAREELPSGYDFTSLGGSRELVEDANWRAIVVRRIRALIDLGAPIDKVKLIDHYCRQGEHGCLAFAGADSREHHERYTQQAARLLRGELDTLGLSDVAVQVGSLHDINAHMLDPLSEKHQTLVTVP